MKTLLKIVLVLVLWQTGILSSILLFLGGVLFWAAALLQPSYLGVL
jgi:hypothetical protein